ncbi:hypothetical protein OG689_13580 [Kitasatospora sp. NBC_00240]|uniref:hypothetical protein n=1 Tax=Kitasatospora sp. NBC_00240 TaxID=2903567 RepID=UPI002254E24E|nr:hypothetical protein [Kitasatospora sp. NBC_00240]MCX5210309.1 hypothetical protein [Kitasatospora sp. NBC_00240]
MTGFQVDPQALQLAAKGIDAAIAELKELGVTGSAVTGRGFSMLELSGLAMGDGELQGAFAGFCDRWEWGVRTLVQDGNEIAVRLGLSAGLYHEQEQYLSGVAKNIASAAMGNPHLTGEDAEQKTWGQIGADNPWTQIEHADYSAESFGKSGDRIGTAWKEAGRDLSNGPLGLQEKAADLAGKGAEYRAVQDQVFGPRPPKPAEGQAAGEGEH